MRYRSDVFQRCPRRHHRRLTIAILGLLLTACAGQAELPQPKPTRPVATLFPTSAIPQPPGTTGTPDNVLSEDTGWITGNSGLSIRRLNVHSVAGHKAAPLVVVRVDPAKVRLRVAYTPDRPRGLGRWFAEEQPLVAINGGFFTSEYQTTALIISDGVANGRSYEGFGGMLAVAQDGSISLQPLHDQPYDPSKPIVQAMQSFPMLVFPGGAPTNFDDNGQRARRTAVAIDRAGDLLLIVSPTSDLTLRELADWLRQSDLAIERALNLDGGPSTGLYLKDGAASEQIDSLGPLPIVLLVEPK